MRKILKKISRLFVNWRFWILDYVYVGFWQFLGFFRRTDVRTFLQPSWDPRKKQIILLPGIYERWEFMKPIATVLLEAGYSVHIIEGLGYNTSTVEQAAKIVEKYAVENDLKKCTVIAHSKGGLIGKYLLSLGEERQRFTGMVALNTPFEGSRYAYLLPFASLRLFTPTSPLIKTLAREKESNKHIYSIYGLFDPHIPGGSYLMDAHNIVLQTYGHFITIHDKRVHNEVLKAVEKLSSI